jgi:6-bladed beta-propeller protein
MNVERTVGMARAAAVLLILQITSHAALAQTSDTIVTLAGPALHRGVANLIEELSIGVLDGADEYTFTNVGDIAVGNDGSVLILDTGSTGLRPFGRPTVRLYDSRGRFIRNVGGVGDGPGEYRQPSSIATMPDGRFLLLDRRNRRLTAYSDRGLYQGSWRIADYNVTIGLPGALRVSPDGVITISFTLSSRPPVGDELPKRTRAIVRMRANGVVIDTILEPRLPSLRVQVTKSRSVVTLPYSPDVFWAWSPLGYSVTGINTRYALDFLLPRLRSAQNSTPIWREGDPILSIRASFPRVPISAAERADHKRSIDLLLGKLPGKQGSGLPDIPRVKPYLRHVSITDNGHIWVWVHSPSVQYKGSQQRTDTGGAAGQVGWREPVLVDVFGPSRRYVGRVRVPDDLQPLKLFGNQIIWGYTRDEFDVPYVKRYRVKWD